MFKGLYPALTTPYANDGSIDYEAYKRLIDKVYNGGVSGFFATGSTAEYTTLTMDERKKLIDVSVSASKGRGKVIIHVGCNSTDMSIELAKYAEEKGADGLIAVQPGYYKFSAKQIVEYYRDIANSVSIPVLAYDIPFFTGRELLSDEYLFDLMSIPNFDGFKGTTYDLYLEERFKRLYPNKTLLHGYDEFLTCALMIGADGGIGGTYVLMPEFFVKLYNSVVVEKDMDKAKKLQHELNAILDKMIPLNHTVAVNYILGLEGIGNGKCRKPFKELTEEEKKILDEVYLDIKKINKGR